MNGPIPVPASPGLGHPSRLPTIPARTRRLVLVTLTGVILTFAALDAALVIPVSFFYDGGAAVGMDYGIYMDRTHDWLAGDGFYRARQLTGAPYEIQNGDSFYPPTLLLSARAVRARAAGTALVADPSRDHRRRPDPHPAPDMDVADHGVHPVAPKSPRRARPRQSLALDDRRRVRRRRLGLAVRAAVPEADARAVRPHRHPPAVRGGSRPGCSSCCRCPSARCGSTTGRRWSTRRTLGASNTRSASGR